MANPTALERSLFEVWAKTQAYDLARMPTNGEYYDQTTNNSWLAWQGRASMPSPFAEPNELDPPGGIQGLHEGRQGAVRSPALLASKERNPVDVALVAELKRLAAHYGGYVGDQLGHAALRLDELSRVTHETTDAQLVAELRKVHAEIVDCDEGYESPMMVLVRRAADALEGRSPVKATAPRGGCWFGGDYGWCELDDGHDGPHKITPQKRSSPKTRGDGCTCASPEPALIDHGLSSLCEECGRTIGAPK